MKKQRVEYIDIAKAIAIFLVLIGHTVSVGTEAKTIIYAFHMQMFFVLSGMVLRTKEEYNALTWKSFLNKKLFTVAVPYVIWGCIYSKFSFKNLAFIAYGTRKTLLLASSLSSLWFLPVLFFGTLLAEAALALSSHFKQNRKIVLCLSAAAFYAVGFLIPHWHKYGDFWSIDIAFVAAAFVMIGFSIRTWFDKISSGKAWIKYALFAVSLLVLLIGTRFAETSEGYVLMAEAVYGSPILFLVNSLAGSFAALSLAQIIASVKFNKSALIYVGQNTLGIFLIHKPIVKLGCSVVQKLNISFDNIAVASAISLVALVISCIGVFIINCFIPQLVGKYKKTEEK